MAENFVWMYNIYMNKMMRIFKGFLLTFYLFFIMYLLLENTNISSLYNFSTWTIPAIAFVSIIILGYYYIHLFLKIGSLEFEFTSIVNHVFRTPLTRIMWITKELEKDLSQEERKLYLQNLENATARILDIVDIIVGIKDVGNTSGYLFKAVYIREIIEKSILKYREKINQKNIGFEVANFKGVPLLTVDLKKISFVIDVLMENAIFYTPENGKIMIDCKLKSDKIIISISDTGLGLDFKDRIHIFSKFYRGLDAKLSNTDGLGLGLYLSRQIIKRHKGQIYARSKGRNKGSTFFIELPFS